MKKLLFVLVGCSLLSCNISAQNITNVGTQSLQSVNDSISLLSVPRSVIINDGGGYIEVNGGYVEVKGTASSKNEDSIVSFNLSNIGANGNKHHWALMTSSYAGNWGVKSNCYETWEYFFDESRKEYGNRRLMIETSRDNPMNFSPFVIGPRGAVNIGYGQYHTSPDINDLSVNGNVGIGTLDTQGYKLAVNGTIRAKEIKVESNWADFVFKKDYILPTLGEVEQHIKDNGTLPGVPSETDVKVNGINMGEANALLLQKIEELTLYAIKQQKLIEKMQVEMNMLKNKIK